MIDMGLVWICDGAEPDFTGLKVCSITSDERPSVLVCTVPPASTSSIFFQLLSVSPPDHGPSPL